MILLSTLIFLSGCQQVQEFPRAKSHDRQNEFSITQIHERSFEQVREKYDTLIPILNGLFITLDTIDTMNFSGKLKFVATSYDYYFCDDCVHWHEQKWGVIDSTGKMIIPFICDGIGLKDSVTGIASVYSSSYSLNTGVPRYMYEGRYFYFNSSGRIDNKETSFQLLVEQMSDNHRSDFVRSLGPTFFLPRKETSER